MHPPWQLSSLTPPGELWQPFVIVMGLPGMLEVRGHGLWVKPYVRPLISRSWATRSIGSSRRCVRRCLERWSPRPWRHWTCPGASGPAATATYEPSRPAAPRTMTACPSSPCQAPREGPRVEPVIYRMRSLSRSLFLHPFPFLSLYIYPLLAIMLFLSLLLSLCPLLSLPHSLSLSIYLAPCLSLFSTFRLSPRYVFLKLLRSPAV